MKNYLRITTAVDGRVGGIAECLDKEGLRENTILIYSSDQGVYMSENDRRSVEADPGRTVSLAELKNELTRQKSQFRDETDQIPLPTRKNRNKRQQKSRLAKPQRSFGSCGFSAAPCRSVRQ